MPTITPPARFTSETPLFQVLADARGHAIVERVLPDLVSSSILHTLHSYPIGLVVETEESLVDRPAVRAELLEAVSAIDLAIEPVTADGERYVEPSGEYETRGTVRGSAESRMTDSVALYGRFELTLQGPDHGNPFVDVRLGADIITPSGAAYAPGFYDGDGRYVVRYLPEQLGRYTFVVRSNAVSLDGVAGSFDVHAADPGAHGPVRVSNRFHFAHADGTRHLPIGTTAYAWTHQGDATEEQTLATLESAPFTKLRMCVFPKSYLFNENEPERFPFLSDGMGGFDTQRFDPEYWAHLERRIDELADRGVEADLILFHAYDRWGFADMGQVADDRYVRYAVARLASFANVWWSLANEYDLLFTKVEEDWERFAAIVQEDDPTHHLLSIHNCRAFYDYSRPWITHASIQRQDIYKTSEMTTEWRRWGKPVVVDECAYEGDIDQGWGNITGEEMTRRFWEGALRGGYVGHGETYTDSEDVLWWSKGGRLRGASPERIAFLHRILMEGPADGLEPLPLDWDVPRAGVDGEYLLYYFGFNQPTYRRFVLDPSVSWTIDVIDTWGMSVERLPGEYSGRFRIELPGRPYLAVRMHATTADSSEG